jgi:endonuclease/exonuclease/phosphatase family metal-dependent hydrolase
MMRLVKWAASFIAFAIILFCMVLAANYFNSSIVTRQDYSEGQPVAGAEISILNWNIGYAGLGKDSDFVMDGGEMLQPPSRETVETNVDGIQNILNANKSDIHLFQEISEPDMLTWGVDVLAAITKTLGDHNMSYSSDFRTRFIPTKWALRHGLATYTRVQSEPVELIRLTLEPTRLGGIVQRQYHIRKTGLTGSDGTEWVVLNIHLSAFDEGGNVRLKQLDELIEIANEYYQNGNHVIVGGDWNIQLSDTEFPTTTKEEFLFWRTKLPRERIKPDWQIVVDETTPTMRSNERTYVKGENFTSIIDGYMVSPNVEVLDVKTIDTNFEYTDHQPIMARFTARK